jgi:hypothetical protein
MARGVIRRPPRRRRASGFTTVSRCVMINDRAVHTASMCNCVKPELEAHIEIKSVTFWWCLHRSRFTFTGVRPHKGLQSTSVINGDVYRAGGALRAAPTPAKCSSRPEDVCRPPRVQPSRIARDTTKP